MPFNTIADRSRAYAQSPFNNWNRSRKNLKEHHVNFKDWAVWLPLATAMLYFYDWVFECFTCAKLHIPVTLIEPTAGSILFFVGIFILFVTFGIFFFGFIYFFLKGLKWWIMTIVAIALPVLMNAAYFIHNWEWSKKDGIRMSILGGFGWGFLVICWILIQVFSKYKAWEWIFNYMFLNGSKKLRELPIQLKRYRLVGFSIIIFFLTWFCASLYVTVSPPDLRILGKEQLVIVKKYGDVMICRYLDSAKNRLNDNIKIIKLEGGASVLTKVIPPPSY